jgi:hypothetical protein
MLFRNYTAIGINELFTESDLSLNLTSFPGIVVLILIIPLLSWFSNLIAKSIILKVFHEPSGNGLLTLSKMNLTI